MVASFGLAAEMPDRPRVLLSHSHAGDLTKAEQAELDEYERIEHLMVLIKSRNLAALTPPR